MRLLRAATMQVDGAFRRDPPAPQVAPAPVVEPAGGLFTAMSGGAQRGAGADTIGAATAVAATGLAVRRQARAAARPGSGTISAA